MMVSVLAATIEKTPAIDPTPPSVFVTVTVRVPTVAVPETVTTRSIRALLVTVVETTVMSAAENVTTAPAAKSVPVTTSAFDTAPTASEVGDVALGVGLALTVSAATEVTVPKSVLETMRSRVPVVAVEVTSSRTVSDVAELTVADVTVTPVPDTATEAPDWKPVPVIVIDFAAAPWPTDEVDSDDTAGAAETVIAPAAVLVGVLLEGLDER